MKKYKPALALHGGAEPNRKKNYDRELHHMNGLIETGYYRLCQGESALDNVVFIATELENSGLYLAGKGTAPTREGQFELDGAIMDGKAQQVGSVCALRNFANPIKIAYDVMCSTPHVMLAGQGARDFALKKGYSELSSPETYFTPSLDTKAATDSLSIGTIGVVALDEKGYLAAASSTGGVLNKLPGRVGDTPLAGSGVWADQHVAVSSTGQGEYFIRTVLAYQISARIQFAQQSLEQAAEMALQDMHHVKQRGQEEGQVHQKKQGGKGGVIALSRAGVITMPYIGSGMKRAGIDAYGKKYLAVFEQEALE